MKYDVVIIGSGLGGLICGYILSKNGLNVAVLEKNASIGGGLQSFTRKGTIFDTGMHYIGGIEEGGPMHKMWKYLDLEKNIKVRKLDPSGYDLFKIENNYYSYAMGYDNFIKSLSDKFPGEYNNIKQYIDTIKKVSLASPLYNLRENISLDSLNYDSGGCADLFIDSITQDKLLRKVLAANLPLYAGIKGKTPLYVLAAVNNAYIHDCYRIVGGGSTIASYLSKSIEKFGGVVIPHSEVIKVLYSGNKIKSVYTSDKRVIESNYFISDIHPASLLKILDSDIIKNSYRKRICGLENSISNFTVYLKFKSNKVRYMNSNFYSYYNDVWGGEKYIGESWPYAYMYMHQAVDEKTSYAEGAILMSYMNYSEVKQWENEPCRERGEEYNDFKIERAERLISLLEADFPNIRESLDSYYTSSPLTYKDYIASPDGSSYGIIKDANNPFATMIPHRTKIENLFLTGQNINFHGALGVSISSVITCSEILGLNKVLHDINNNI